MMRPPIRISGEIIAGQTEGITSGTGSVEDPFIMVGLVVNSSLEDGIVIENVNKHLVIRDCYVLYGMERGVSGIRISNSTNITVMSCGVFRTWTGINISGSSGISLLYDRVASTHTGYLLNINDSRVIGCSAEWNGYYGMRLTGSNKNHLEGITSSNNCGVLGVATGLLMQNSSDNKISNCSFDLNYGEGISLMSGSNGNHIWNCSMNLNVNGLFVSMSGPTYIEGCVFKSNVNGINIASSRQAWVEHCTFRSNSNALYLYKGGNSTILGCEMTSNERGICIFSSPSNHIEGNRISNGSGYAVEIGNRMGAGMQSTGNIIHGNRFISNNGGRVQAKDQGIDTRWESKGRGNLWSDLPGPDDDADGIVDISYRLDGGEDPFPIAFRVGAEEGESEKKDNGDDGAMVWAIRAAAAMIAALFLSPFALRRR